MARAKCKQDASSAETCGSSGTRRLQQQSRGKIIIKNWPWLWVITL